MSNELFLGPDLYEHKLRYQADLNRTVMLVSKKQQQDLWFRAMDGDKAAWDQLWLQGVKMVQKLVSKFIQLGKILPGDELDAIQEGNLAIGEALPNWSPNRGAYSTYVWTCIRNSLTDFNTAESRGGLTGEGAEDCVHDAMEVRAPSQNDGNHKIVYIADVYGYAEDLDVDLLALFMDYERELTGEEREVMNMWLYHDMSQEQIGAVVGLSRPTITRMVQEAVDKLRVAYSKSV